MWFLFSLDISSDPGDADLFLFKLSNLCLPLGGDDEKTEEARERSTAGKGSRGTFVQLPKCDFFMKMKSEMPNLRLVLCFSEPFLR